MCKCGEAQLHSSLPPHASSLLRDPVIQIANMVILQGEKVPFVRNVFTLNSCAPIVGSEVLSYQREGELLQVCADIKAGVLLVATY